MCGISGVVQIDPRATGFDTARQRVAAMLAALLHRGPDDSNLAETEGAVLGATRLAIRGLEDGKQPMLDPKTGIMAVCNGEIDNHRELRAWLQSRGRDVPQKTDVAVIPGLYAERGSDFAEGLIGAFAAAIWDPRHGRLTLARDRTGERSLFFARQGGVLVFATELAALVGQGRLAVTLNKDSLRKYLQFGIFPSPDSPFTEVHKVAPGEVVEIDAAGIRRRRYWRWPNVAAPKAPQSLDAFDTIFREAVRRQSDVDVDFGVFLSGGIDSSLVSAVLQSLQPKRRLKAYTLRFEEDSFDEGSFAETVATQLGMESVPVWVRPDHVREEMRALVRRVGEPLADPAWIPAALLARRAAQDIRIALVGEGADELFGGYPTYIGAGVAQKFAQCPAWLRTLLRRAVELLPPSDKKVTLSFLLKRFVSGADLPGLARHHIWVSNIAPPLLRRLGVEPVQLDESSPPGATLLDLVQRWDLEVSLAEGLLTKADRASMASALELRAPFLDLAVLQFAALLPVDQRVRRFQTKAFLKRYALRYLPPDIVHRRKRGLSVPLGTWLRGPLREWAETSLANPRLEQAGVHPAAALALFTEHCQRKADHARALWTLLVLGEWLDWVAEQKPSAPG
jgi:asparagine synthase (glutamine-hydrolysing)